MMGAAWISAPALAAADVGIAIGAAGSDAAIESADIAFTGNDLRLLPQALAHVRQGRRIINQNIVLSLLIIIVLLPLAITGVLGLAAVVPRPRARRGGRDPQRAARRAPAHRALRR